MIKSFVVILLSCFLTLSIFSPSVMSLIRIDHTVVINDFEEENIDVEDTDVENTDIEEEGEEHFFQSSVILNESLTVNNNLVSIIVIDDKSAYSLDIQLPPPEYIV